MLYECVDPKHRKMARFYLSPQSPASWRSDATLHMLFQGLLGFADGGGLSLSRSFMKVRYSLVLPVSGQPSCAALYSALDIFSIGNAAFPG